MINPFRPGWRRLAAFVFAAALVPAIARGQDVTGTPSPDGAFAPLLSRLKPGQTAIVVDHAGQTVTGRVTALSSSSIVLIRDRDTQTFAPADVTTIKRDGPVWDGAVKGAAIAAVPWLILASHCFGCGGAGKAFVNMTLTGATIGLLIDSAFGPKTVYKAPEVK